MNYTDIWFAFVLMTFLFNLDKLFDFKYRLCDLLR